MKAQVVDAALLGDSALDQRVRGLEKSKAARTAV
jgi:hypothetical protein